MKKLLAKLTASTLLSTVLVGGVLTGCGGGTEQSVGKNDTSTGDTQVNATSDAGGITTIKFYGSDAEYNKTIVSKFEAENADIKVEIVPVDFDNAEQVIKTGIASGNPVDVSFFWGTQVSTFVNNGMATDLTPYLTENNNEWMNTFIPKYIDGGKINDKYYAISYQPVIETLFYNKDIFDQYNIEVPTTWDEYMAACAILKENGIYGMGNWTGQNHQLLTYAYQEMANKGVLEEVTSGQIPFSGENEAPGLRTVLTMIKEAYDKGYWYPGEGALTSTKDQVQAAFYQGKIATLYDAGSNLGTYKDNASFNLGVMKFPILSAESKYGVNVVTNALFVPENAKHKEEAVRFIKFYTSEVGQQETMNSGRLPSTKAMQDKIADPLMKDLMMTTEGDNVVSYTHMQNLSAEINSFIQNDLVGYVCAGESIDSMLESLEGLRQDIIK